MSSEHALADEVLQEAQSAFESCNYWIAYNNHNYFLDKGDVYFFNSRYEASEFAANNISEYDSFTVIYASSIVDLLQQLPYGRSINNILNNNNHPLKTNFMNQENLNYLKENLKYMGFGDKLQADLEKNMQQGFPEFVLKMPSEFSQKNMESTLFFKKSDQTDMYFFNRFDAELSHKNDPAKNIRQTFYLNKGHGVTLKEAFNLLEGRAVSKELSNKEGQKFNAWIQLDFKEKEENGNYKTKQFHENYGYDLNAALKEFPIKELGNEQQRDRLMMSLEKGNIQSVTMTKDAREQMFFIEANPQFKTISVYDAHMKLLGKDQKAELNGKTTMDQGQNHIQDKKDNKPEQNIKETREEQSPNLKKNGTINGSKENVKKEKQPENSLPAKDKNIKKGAEAKLLPQKEKEQKKGMKL